MPSKIKKRVDNAYSTAKTGSMSKNTDLKKKLQNKAKKKK